MLNRQFSDFGIHPLLGYLLIAAGFTVLSLLVFARLQYAPYAYTAMSMALLLPLQQGPRNQFLQSCFGKPSYQRLRITENLILSLPFAIFLIGKGFYWHGIVLLAICSLMSLFRFGFARTWVLPTPFYKQPFESITGFRRNLWLLLACYAVVGISAWVGNANLGLVSIMGLFITCMLFYQYNEPIYYAWIFTLSPAQFLWYKTKIALLHTTLICLPAAILLGLAFAGSWPLLAGIFVLGLLYVVTVQTAKYAVFPNSMNLPQVILLILGMTVPPLLLALLPHFYIQSQKRLQAVLV